jgi:hypothetical protein
MLTYYCGLYWLQKNHPEFWIMLCCFLQLHTYLDFRLLTTEKSPWNMLRSFSQLFTYYLRLYWLQNNHTETCSTVSCNLFITLHRVLHQYFELYTEFYINTLGLNLEVDFILRQWNAIFFLWCWETELHEIWFGWMSWKIKTFSSEKILRWCVFLGVNTFRCLGQFTFQSLCY